MLMTLIDGRDAARWGHTETLVVRSTSSGSEAGAWNTKAGFKGVMWIVSHLSEAASVQTHIDGRFEVIEYVQEVLRRRVEYQISQVRPC